MSLKESLGALPENKRGERKLLSTSTVRKLIGQSQSSEDNVRVSPDVFLVFYLAWFLTS